MQIKKMSKFFLSFPCKTALFLYAFFLVGKFCNKQTKGFSTLNITSALSYHQEWATPDPDPALLTQLQPIFSQPYYYLGDGGQTYSFVSEDGNTVVKFFKFHHMRVPYLFKKLPLPSFLSITRDRFVQKCEAKLPRTLTSCKLAYEEFKEESGLIYLHLNKTNFWHRSITVYDPIGISHQIDLDQTEFVVQRKAILVFNDLKNMIEHAQIQEVQERIDSILHFLYVRCKKGIKDNDNGLKRNFGIVDSSLIEVDIGSFSKTNELKNNPYLMEELKQKTRRLSRILSKRSPDLLTYYHEKLQALCNTDENDSL